MIGSCSNALISSSIASLQRVTGRTLENRISILKKWNSNRQTKFCANDCRPTALDPSPLISILQIKPPVADGFVFANDPYFRDFLDLFHFWNSV